MVSVSVVQKSFQDKVTEGQGEKMTNLVYSWFVPGKPQGKERPRKGLYGNFYTPPKTHKYEELVRLSLFSVYRKSEVVVDARHAWDVSFTVYGKCRSDRDNVEKCILDSLQGVVYKNDLQVYRATWEYNPTEKFNGKTGVAIDCESMGLIDRRKISGKSGNSRPTAIKGKRIE